jgi:biotin carboxyl carrier protein
MQAHPDSRRPDPAYDAFCDDVIARVRAWAFDGRVLAPAGGVVAELLVAPGERVEHGQGLVVLEAMKTLFTIVAEGAGTVTRVAVATGDAVRAQQLLAVLSPPEDEDVARG